VSRVVIRTAYSLVVCSPDERRILSLYIAHVIEL
jgi:hypothetical protein